MSNHETKMSRARAAGALRGFKAASFDRRKSKRARNKMRCRNKDPHKWG